VVHPARMANGRASQFVLGYTAKSAWTNCNDH